LNKNEKYYIEKLNLTPHPEGGYFKEVYRSGEIIEAEHLPARYSKKRNISTSIYFLLEGNQVSKFHRLKSDEIWHFYDGSPIKIYIIIPAGNLQEKILGKDLDNGELPQLVIEKGSWFGAKVVEKKSFSFIGCTVSPGFDFDDFELADKQKMLNDFPAYHKIINGLT
jgi:hypothetical protein